MTMKLKRPRLTAAAISLCLIAAPVLAQTTGVSHPEDLPNDVNAPQQAQPLPGGDHYVKPSPAIPADNPDNAQDTAQPVYTPSPAPALTPRAPVSSSTTAANTDSFVVTDDINSGIVTEVPVGPNELPIGTNLTAELQNSVSTTDTQVGAPFTATLTAEVSRHNIVLLPVGAIISGRVTRVRGGRAIGGPAAIRLQPDTISMPDGTTYRLDAEVIDLDNSSNSHVNSEGTIVDDAHPKATLAVLGGATGVAAVSGAAVGGPVGAAVGAGIGAGVGTIWWLRHDREETLPQGTSIVFSLDNSLKLTPEGQLRAARQ